MLPSLKFLDDADADGNEADESDGEDGPNGTLDEEGSDEDGKFLLRFLFHLKVRIDKQKHDDCKPRVGVRVPKNFLICLWRDLWFLNKVLSGLGTCFFGCVKGPMSSPSLCTFMKLNV
jgi:hypothetical protein